MSRLRLVIIAARNSLGFGEGPRCVDKTDVAERLRKVALALATHRIASSARRPTRCGPSSVTACEPAR